MKNNKKKILITQNFLNLKLKNVLINQKNISDVLKSSTSKSNEFNNLLKIKLKMPNLQNIP